MSRTALVSQIPSVVASQLVRIFLLAWTHVPVVLSPGYPTPVGLYMYPPCWAVWSSSLVGVGATLMPILVTYCCDKILNINNFKEMKCFFWHRIQKKAQFRHQWQVDLERMHLNVYTWHKYSMPYIGQCIHTHMHFLHFQKPDSTWHTEFTTQFSELTFWLLKKNSSVQRPCEEGIAINWCCCTLTQGPGEGGKEHRAALPLPSPHS